MNMTSIGAATVSSPRVRIRPALAGILCIALLAIAGVLGAKVQTGGTGRTEFGAIDDFGSIVVNGIHYDESAALITIDGIPHQPSSALKLGMIVQIDGTLDYATLRGVAETVQVNRTLYGQLESGPDSAGEIRILSQAVAVMPATRFDGVAAAASMAVGDWFAIHGLEDPGKKTLVATLIERIAVPIGSQSSIRGSVRNAHPGRFRIGSLDVDAAGLSAPDDGDYVAVVGRYASGSGRLMADSVSQVRVVETREDNETEVTGFVTDFRSTAAFVIAGVPVDASNATVEDGRPQDVKNGTLVTVEGQIRNGVLVADEIEIKSGTTSSTATAASRKTEIEGTVSAFNSVGDFTVRGVRIDASNALVVNKSKRADVAGLKAHVKGYRNSDGSIRAKVVEFERP